MNGTFIIARFAETPEYQPSTTLQTIVGTVLVIWKLSYVETGAGHVPYVPNNETQYVVLTKSGSLINIPPPPPPPNTVIVPGVNTRPPYAEKLE